MLQFVITAGYSVVQLNFISATKKVHGKTESNSYVRWLNYTPQRYFENLQWSAVFMETRKIKYAICGVANIFSIHIFGQSNYVNIEDIFYGFHHKFHKKLT